MHQRQFKFGITHLAKLTHRVVGALRTHGVALDHYAAGCIYIRKYD
jgi:hypothetical protein